jgi:PIN domain nuclease of toxin-antitoxin system
VKILLDTAAFWWIATGSSRLSRRAAEAVANPANEISLNPVSIWELVVKNQIGKLPTPAPIGELLTKTLQAKWIRPLPLTHAAVLKLPELPPLHCDPFDRMLICQALDAGMTLVTPDEQVQAYPVATLWT